MKPSGKPLPSSSILIHPPRLAKRLKLCQVEPEFPLIPDSELESPLFDFVDTPPLKFIPRPPTPAKLVKDLDEFFQLPLTPRLGATDRPATPIPPLPSMYSSPFLGSSDVAPNTRTFPTTAPLDVLMEVACFDSFVNRTYPLRNRNGLLKCRE
jgi:hypothetical protein